MSPPIIENSPEYVICHFCKENVKGEPMLGGHMLYSCSNHYPLIINYYWAKMSSENWVFYQITVVLPNKFKLSWLKRKYPEDEDPGFSLFEWNRAIIYEREEGWRSFKNIYFPSDWVLSQTPARLQSILELYTTFS